MEFLSESWLPGCFRPPGDEVFGYRVEIEVRARVGEEPVREDVDVGVAMSG